jgi:hypothetical protein
MKYAGRDLTMEPANGITLEEIAERLRAGLPTRVVLEPGDATRYEFLLVPLSGQTEGCGGYGEGSIAHIPCNLTTDGQFLAVRLSEHRGEWTFATYRNAHARAVMAAFYAALQEAAGL